MEEYRNTQEMLPEEPRPEFVEMALIEHAEKNDATEVIEKKNQYDEIDRLINLNWAIEQFGMSEDEVRELHERASAIEREELDRNDYERRRDNVKKFGGPALKASTAVAVL